MKNILTFLLFMTYVKEMKVDFFFRSGKYFLAEVYSQINFTCDLYVLFEWKQPKNKNVMKFRLCADFEWHKIVANAFSKRNILLNVVWCKSKNEGRGWASWQSISWSIQRYHFKEFTIWS